MRTASRRNASAYLFAILYLLHRKYCSKETGTKPRQVHLRSVFLAAAIDIGLLHPPPQRVPATSDLGRDCHDRRRLIGILMLVFQNHPNRACANLGRKPVCSVTFFHRLHPYLLWSLRQTGGGSVSLIQFRSRIPAVRINIAFLLHKLGNTIHLGLVSTDLL